MSDLLPHVQATYQATYLGLDGLLDGRYQVLQILSSGAWGQTFLAQDTRRPSQPECIIQRITPLGSHPDYHTALRHLFVREAATLESLGGHDQLPQLLACFEDEQGFYLVQESVEGEPLTHQLHSNRPWSKEHVIQLLLNCLEPLAFVHRHCCRHGDLRPDHMIRRSSDGQWVLTHFGSVREIHLSLMTLSGCSTQAIVPNDQGYQAPEQVQGLPCLASDIYALGLIGIQALTGLHPSQFQKDPKTGELLWRSFWHSLCVGIDAEQSQGLVTILERMIKPDCTQRYSSAIEALQALQSLLAGGSPIQSAIEGTATLRHDINDSTSSAVNQENLTSAVSPAQFSSDQFSSDPLDASSVWFQANPLDANNVSGRTRAASGLLTSSALQLGVGFGAVVATAVCGYALPHLLDHSDRGNQTLDQAATQYQAGKLQQAVRLATSIPETSTAYSPARASISRWQKDWQAAERQYQVIEVAFQQGKWSEVVQQAQRMPKIDYWQQRLSAMVLQATVKAETESTERLKHAFTKAADKDFTAALADLNQIPASTANYPKAQAKIREYREKQRIKAISQLQQAYDRAALHDFNGALAYLKQIPQDTSIYAKAQVKIKEYTDKQQLVTSELPALTPLSPAPLSLSTDNPAPVNGISQDLNPGSYLREANL